MKKKSLFITLFMVIIPISLLAQSSDLIDEAESAIQKGVRYFHSINAQGGYVYYVTPDLSRRWGEGPKDSLTIEVQPPGTPAVGHTFLKAYRTTGDEKALTAAKNAAMALIKGQNRYGGWDHTINFANISHESISFDDNQTQSAVSFLIDLDKEIDDHALSAATQRAVEMMIATQLKNGAWPHKYPEQGNYHDYATFNDGGINDCIRVMIEAHRHYPDNKELKKSLRKAARFMNISQLPPPQPGWAQQYNEFLQPAWARTFEPPSLCPAVTVKNINTLIDLYVALQDETLLEPIPDAIKWLREIRMENGKWARCVEIGTNKALYYDRPRIRVDKLEDLHPERRTGYAYEVNILPQLEASNIRYEKAVKMNYEEFRKEESAALSKDKLTKRLKELSASVKEIINAQHSNGAWITKNDKFKKHMPANVRWNGQFEVMDRVSSAVFNQNIETLCEYINLDKLLNIYTMNEE